MSHEFFVLQGVYQDSAFFKEKLRKRFVEEGVEVPKNFWYWGHEMVRSFQLPDSSATVTMSKDRKFLGVKADTKVDSLEALEIFKNGFKIRDESPEDGGYAERERILAS